MNTNVSSFERARRVRLTGTSASVEEFRKRRHSRFSGIWKLAMAGISMTFLIASQANAQTRIATVDLSKVLGSYNKTKQAEEVLKSQGQDLEKTHRTLVDEYKKASEAYRNLLDSANNQAVAREEREKSKQAAEAKLLSLKELEVNINQHERQAQATFDEQKRRVMDNLLREIRVAVAARAKAGNFGVVLDSSSQAAPTSVLYASGENDLTDEIIRQLNAAFPNKPADNGSSKPK